MISTKLMKMTYILSLLCFFSVTNLFSQDRHPVHVHKIVDGDTFWATDESGKEIKFRPIGFDCPEKSNFGRPAEPFNEEATAELTSLIYDKTVFVEYDINPKGKYGRDLVYVFLQDGTLVNEVMIRKGWAELMTYPPNLQICAICYAHVLM